MYKTDRLLYLLALVKIIIPYLLQSPVYEPQRDEFLYLAEGHHLAFGFMEVPPMLSVFAWLTNVFGGGMFWIKLWPSLFGAATFIIAGKIIQSLGGRSFALFFLFLSFISGVYLRLFFLFQPNPHEVFFWTLIAYSLVRFTQTEKNKWLYVFAVSGGLGMPGKYSVAFFAISTLAGLLFTPYKKVFINKHFWFASLIGLIIFLPNALWQFRHHLPVIHHMQQLQHVSAAGFLIDQLLMNLACVAVWLAGLWFVSFNKTGKNYRFLALAQACSDNASFLYWLPDTMHIDNMLLLTDDKQEMQHPFIKNFQTAVLSDSVTNMYAREHGSLIILLKGANESFNDMFRQKIEKDKAVFKY